MALELAVRGGGVTGARRFVATLASVLFCGAVLTLARAKWRAAVGATFGLIAVTQGTFAYFWHTFLDRQVAESAVYHGADVRAVLGAMALRVVSLGATGALLGGALAVIAGPLPLAARAPVRASAACALLLLLAAGPPLRAATPEVATLDAVAFVATRSARSSARVESRAAVPAVEVPAGRALPNVVFVLTESVRADDGCAAPNAPCPTMPRVHGLMRDRIPLLGMRAVSSYTAVSLSALLTGRTQEGPRESIATAPTLFDLVRATTRSEQRPYVAFWSAQMASVFERAEVARSVDSFVSVETLVGRAIEDEDEVVDRGVDALLANHVEKAIAALPEPFFLFLQLAGTHAPYYVDEARAPFVPWSRTVSWSKLPELRSAYKNAIVAQDASVARMLERIFDRNGKAPLVVLFTSDHGEAFGEHGAIHHGQNVYDEQLHVPAWIASRNGALSGTALGHLAARRDRTATHLDLLPTVLDVYGTWQSFGLREFTRRLPGRSLLDAPAPFAPVPITNCTTMFPCPLHTWGVLGESALLGAQAWDADWHCLPLEGANEPKAAACEALRRASMTFFAKKPNGAPNY